MTQLTRAAIRALHELTADGAELTYAKGGGYWIDTRRISSSTANELLRLCVIRVTYGKLDDYCTFEITADGRKMLENPDHTPEIVKALRRVSILRERATRFDEALDLMWQCPNCHYEGTGREWQPDDRCPRCREPYDDAEAQPTWLRRHAENVVGGAAYRVYLNGTQWAIVKEPGRKYFGGTGRPQSYAPVRYVLYSKTDNTRRELHTGRLTRADHARLAKTLKLTDECGEPVLLQAR